MLIAGKIVLVVLSLLLIAVILLQSGRSGGLGAITGGGNEVGASRRNRGTDPTLAKVTTVVGILFYIVALAIAWFVTHP